MMKYFALIILFQIHSILYAQPYKSDIEFYDYNILIKDLKAKGVSSSYLNNLDYESMLYVDRSSLSTLKTINPNFINEWDIDTTKLFIKPLSQYIYYFKLKSNDLKDVFLDIEFFKKTISTIVQMDKIELDKNIYIKNNRIAVFQVSANSWSGKYRATIVNDKLMIEMLYEQIVE
jgi:hypothetical protein